MLNANTHDHLTRQMFHVPMVDSSSYGLNSLKYSCPNLWNKLWSKVVATDNNKYISFESLLSIHSFRKNIKKHFIYIYSQTK